MELMQELVNIITKPNSKNNRYRRGEGGDFKSYAYGVASNFDTRNLEILFKSKQF